MTATQPVNILLVDDQPAKLLSYEAILGDMGANLIKANSAREALEVLLKNDVAVVLVDVCMPEFDGFDLARMLREHPRYERTAIIFISAIHLSDLDRIRGYETGAVDYVPVPVVPEILRAKVRIFAELWRRTRESERLNDELERRVAERTVELEATAARLREAADRLQLASEAAGFGTYDYNAAAGEIYWSPDLRRLIGIEGEAPLTLERALSYIHPEHRQLVHDHIVDESSGGRRELEFKIVRPDGEVRWLLDRGRAVAGESGLRVMGTVLDITDRKLNEERQRLLMAELDHRVRNILSNVLAVTRLSSHRAQSVEAFVDSLDGRIQAMARAHELLRRGAWTGASLADFAAEALLPFRSRSGTNIEIGGDPIVISPALAQTMAVVLHELATNAVKHGSLSVPEGRVRISWTRPSEDRLRFVWEEWGGPPVTAPAKNGFGLTVLQTAPSQFGAISLCEFREKGFVYTVEAPLQLGKEELSEPMSKASRKERAPQEAGDANAAPRRVLIVEDEALVAMQLQADLQEEGHQVVGPAMSVEHGLRLAETEEIDVALIDVRLGRDTSAAIAEALLSRQIPFAFATGYSDVAMLPGHLRGVPRLNKPYTVEEVREMFMTLTMRRGRPPVETSVVTALQD